MKSWLCAAGLDNAPVNAGFPPRASPVPGKHSLLLSGKYSLLHFFEKAHDDRDRVGLVAGFHCFAIFCPVFVEGGDLLDDLVGGLFVLEDFAEALLGEGVRVEDLVAAAALGGQGDEKARLAQGEDLADRVGARAGNQQVGRRKEVLEVVLDVLELARETSRSAAAKRCLRSSLTYSNWR